MKKIKFHILWPGGNTTALIEEKFPRDKYVSIARRILDADKTIEQVGFLENPENGAAAVRLQMMGGEFCGNATRAAAYLWSTKTGLKSFEIEVSGFHGLLNASIENNKVQLEFPGEFFQGINYEGTGPNKMAIIDLLGIRFVTQSSDKSLEQARRLIEKHRADFPAVGVLYIGDFTASASPFTQQASSSTFTELDFSTRSAPASTIAIDPIVWVRDTDTCYNETACGSGSIAAAIAAFSEISTANSEKSSTFSILQPSGEAFTIEIHGSVDEITKIKFSGTVKYLCEKTISLS